MHIDLTLYTHKVLVPEAPVAVAMLLLRVAAKVSDGDAVALNLRNSRSINIIVLRANKYAHLIEEGREREKFK